MATFWSSPSTKHAYWLSVVSLICTISAATAGIVLFEVRKRVSLIHDFLRLLRTTQSMTFLQRTGSSLCLVYGLENCVDFLSSMVVLWRFYAPSEVSDELEQKLSRREKRASVLISFILILLGINVISAAISDFTRGEEDPEGLRDIMAISAVSLLIFGALTCFKFRYAKALQSASLNKDGVCSLIGLILAGALLVNTMIIEKESKFWWLDPVVSMGCGCGAMWYGVRCVYKARYEDKLPIFTAAWWLTSQGDGKDEVSGRPIGPDDYPIRVDDEQPAGSNGGQDAESELV